MTFRASLLAGVVMLAACGGGGGGHSALLPVPQATTQSAGSARFVITIPKMSSTSKRPAYISPSTQSLTLVVKQGATTVVNQTASLTPTSSGCTSTLASTQCVLMISLAPGSYTATITTFDGAAGAGNILSSGQNIAFTIVAGQANTVALTLDGVPASYLVVATSSSVTGSMASGFAIAGIDESPQGFIVEALDADGNTIVGPGAPSYALSVTSGAGWTATNPATTTPNNFTVTSPATGSTATIKATASFPDIACSALTTACSTTFTYASTAQTLFVVNCGNVNCTTSSGDKVLIYAPPYTGAPTVVTSSLNGPVAAALDNSKNLWVVNAGNTTVTEYASPYTGAAIRTVAVASHPNGVAFDALNDLIVSSEQGEVQIFPFPYTSSTSIVSSSDPMPPVALDASSNMFISEDGIPTGFAVLAASAYVTQTASLNAPGNVGCMHVSSSGVAYFTLPIAGAGAIAQPPYTSFTGTDSGGPYDSTFDSAGHQFTASFDGGIREYNLSGPPPIKTILSGTNDAANFSSTNFFQCQYFAVDTANDLFALYNGKNVVAIYAPPYSGAPAIVSSGMTNIQGVLLGP